MPARVWPTTLPFARISVFQRRYDADDQGTNGWRQAASGRREPERALHASTPVWRHPVEEIICVTYGMPFCVPNLHSMNDPPRTS